MDASGERAALHTNSSESLFFYENMQGNAPHGKGLSPTSQTAASPTAPP